MDTSQRRLIFYVSSLIGLLLGAELLARLGAPAFEAVSHRVRFKLALLERHGPTALLYVGTSRFNDGISPRAIAARLARGDGARDFSGFNAATPSASLKTLDYVVRTALGHPGLRAALIELSAPQIRPESPDAMDLSSLGAPVGPSRLLRYRRALVVDNLPRFLGLLAAPASDGSEWFRSRWLVELARPGTASPDELQQARWRPTLRRGEGRAPTPLTPPLEEAAQVYEALAARLAAASIETFWVVPPISRGLSPSECVPELQGLYEEIARRSQRPVWDFSCADFPGSLFTDGTEHLGALGRAYFSEALARQLATELHVSNLAPRSPPALQ